ncbi:nucleoside deaminase [Desulfobacula sp.]|uniref:nucleoside deaminase n=1 Tax=Desulfobacula sp. TaxID=2593537 RepID=UPI00260237A7|nr:nucleoside deaminase [Desulfobacula sp.]
MEYEHGMGLALEQARIAFARGDFPVGCVIVQEGRVMAVGARQGTNRERGVSSEIDHAEINALKHLETIDLPVDPKRCILFCTMEPCLMCFGAIILSGIKKIVYAYEDPMGGGTRCDLKNLPPLYEQCGIEIVSGVLREKSLDLFYNFFNKESNRYWKNSYLEAYTLTNHQRERVTK